MSAAPRRIHFAGGGTGGHLFPALALAQEFRRRFPSAEIVFWGTKRGIEYRLGEKLGFPLRLISVRGVRRGAVLANLAVPFRLAESLIRVLWEFLSRRPDLVVGTGGYVSGPVGFAAVLLRIPLVLQEQNSFPGATTRLLARWAERTYLTYGSSRRYFPRKVQSKLRLLGNPVRSMPALGDREEGARYFGLDPRKRTLFVFGGSQGALAVNRLVAEMVEELVASAGIQVLWATGPAHHARLARRLAGLSGVRLLPFIERMDLAYAASDLVLSRAGATTLAELQFAGKPAVLIPLPTAAAGHQEFNARELEAAGAAICLVQKGLTPQKVRETVEALLRDDRRLQQMSQKMKGLARPHAVTDIVSDICRALFADC